MDEVKAPDGASKKKKSSNMSVTIRFNRTFFMVALAVIVLVVVFFLGSSYGANQEKGKSGSSSRTNSSLINQNRWTAVGTVQEVSDSQIKVKDSRDQIKEASITKETKIVDRKGTDLSAKDIKKDQRVIISGEKDGDKLTATRIRIQQ